MIEIGRGNPPKFAVPFAEIAAASRRATINYRDLLHLYDSPEGFRPLREFLALQHYGVTIDQVIISNGSMNLFSILAEVLLKRTDTVFVESPTYDFALDVLYSRQVTIRGIKMDVDGIDLSKLTEAITYQPPRLIYLIPDFQNPTGGTLSLEKRKALANLAYKYDFLIIEDVAYRPLRYSGMEVTSLYELAPERTVQLGTFSKTIAPCLRVGYAIGKAEIIKLISEAAKLHYVFPNTFSQAVVYELICNGNYLHRLIELKDAYGSRLQTLLNSLKSQMPATIKWADVEGGFFIGLFCNYAISNKDLVELTHKFGLSLLDGARFFPPSTDAPPFIRIAFPGLNDSEAREFVTRLKLALANLETH